ncbi:uncharacterized protein BXZ73DRAFT_80961 [Epithele typhae]|uniref:uncharacterized protein n=1 Tax=Epithele typhae TaxID=378194 RepID=UPI002008081F|nr:uncharacterized protein BXZ73DRAFT_80961 [Epithele typhae]KAH9916997.1 hypothetical protein BXZ73DRAFT_80961 [Epithele typhae]
MNYAGYSAAGAPILSSTIVLQRWSRRFYQYEPRTYAVAFGRLATTAVSKSASVIEVLLVVIVFVVIGRTTATTGRFTPGRFRAQPATTASGPSADPSFTNAGLAFSEYIQTINTNHEELGQMPGTPKLQVDDTLHPFVRRTTVTYYGSAVDVFQCFPSATYSFGETNNMLATESYVPYIPGSGYHDQPIAYSSHDGGGWERGFQGGNIGGYANGYSDGVFYNDPSAYNPYGMHSGQQN